MIGWSVYSENARKDAIVDKYVRACRKNFNINQKGDWLIDDWIIWMSWAKKYEGKKNHDVKRIKVRAKRIKRNKCEKTLTCLFTLFTKI